MDGFPPKNDLYTILFEEAPIGLGLSDMTGKLIMYNKMFLKISGFTAEEVEKIGNVTNFYYNPGDRDIILNKTMKAGFLDNYPVKFKKKDGTYFEALMSLRSVTYENTLHWLALIQDVSEQLQYKKKIEEKIAELEKVNQAMIGRELKMAELKETIADLTAKLNKCLAKNN